MAANPFDQFDDHNPFNQFDEQEKPSSWGTLEDFVKGTGGVAAGAGDIIGGALKMPLAWGLGVGGTLRGESADVARKTGQQAVEELFPSIGETTGMNQTPAYKAMMKPFDWLGQAVEKGGDVVGKVAGEQAGGTAKLTADAILMGGAIPGSKAVGRGFKKVAETLDPGLRKIGMDAKAEAKAQDVQRQQEARDQAKVVEKPPTPQEPIVDTRSGLQKSKEAYEAALRERELAQESVFNYVDENGKPLPPVDESGIRNPFDVAGEVSRSEIPGEAEGRGISAQEAIDWRQEVLDQEVKQRVAREQEAKLRGEQEKAPVYSEEHLALEQSRAEAEARVKQEQMHQEELKAQKEQTQAIQEQIKASEERQQVAQAELEKRQTELELEVKKQGTLDFNAAERSRQETGAPVPTDAFPLKPAPLGSKARKEAAARGKKPVHPYDMPEGSVELGMGLTPPKAFREFFDRALRSMENDLAAGPATTIPVNPEIKSALEKARTEKDGKLWNLTQSGGTSAAYKTGSTLIDTARLFVQNGFKQADYAIRQHVFPAEKVLRSLSKQEVIELAKIMRDEDASGRKLDGDILAANLSAKQLAAYDKMRSMFEATYKAQNAERVAKGLPEITRREAYMASKWVGDFRRPVYEPIKNSKGEVVLDKDGNPAQKLVWYLAANSRLGLNKQWKALSKDNPELILGAEHAAKFTPGQHDIQAMYTKMLDILGRDDPAVARVQKMWEDYQQVEASFTKGQQKHFETKAGVRGFVGDRPGVDAFKDSLEMFQQNIQYAKNAFQWSEMQKAADGIKQLLSDKQLNLDQPNNVSYVREYFKNALGQSESHATRAVSEGLANATGVSPKVLQKALGDVKGFFILQKIGVSSGFVLANVFQSANVIPYLMHMTNEGYGSKTGMVKALAGGIPTGLMMTVAHYLKAKGGSYMEKLPNQFLKDMFKYAEENGVNSRSIYDESPLSHSFGPTATAGRAVATTISTPETLVRSIAFSVYSTMLKESGKFTDMNKLFQKAEDYVNMSMVDYRTSEKPMLFPKMGTIGSFLNTLQTYPISFYNQYAHMTKYAKDGLAKGSVTATIPLMSMLFLQYQLAGAMGAPGVNDAYKLYMWAKDNLLSTEHWQDAQESEFASDPKLWAMENMGNSAVYGALSERTGLGLSAKVSAPNPSEMFATPLGPFVDLTKQANQWRKAAADPTNIVKWVGAARASAFPTLQGQIETNPWGEGITYNTRKDGTKVYLKPSDLPAKEGQFARTAKEESIRRWGLRPQSEVKAGETLYDLSHQETVGKEKANSVVDAFYAAARKGDEQKTRELAALYTRMTGKEIQNSQIDNQVKQEFYTSLEKAQTSPAMTIQQLKNIARYKRAIEESK